MKKYDVKTSYTAVLKTTHSAIGKLAWQQAGCHGNHMTANRVGKQGCLLPRMIAVLFGKQRMVPVSALLLSSMKLFFCLTNELQQKQ